MLRTIKRVLETNRNVGALDSAGRVRKKLTIKTRYLYVFMFRSTYVRSARTSGPKSNSRRRLVDYTRSTRDCVINAQNIIIIRVARGGEERLGPTGYAHTRGV